MKRIAPLLLLPLLLAACGQPAAPNSTAQLRNSATLGQSGVSYADTQAAYDAQVMADLNRLSAQGVKAKVYLNVLPVAKTDDSVRAYVKSSFAAPVTCSVTWGDGSAATSVASPTVKNVETTDHAYATFGSYTITTTCLNGETVVGTQSVTVQAGKKAMGVTLDFENPVAPAGGFLTFETYTEKGFTFTSTSNDLLIHATTSNSGYNTNHTQGILSDITSSVRTMTASDNSLFNLLKFDYHRIVSSPLEALVTGYKEDGSTVTLSLIQNTDASTTVTLDSTWTHLTRIEISNPTGQYNEAVLDNVNVSK